MTETFQWKATDGIAIYGVHWSCEQPKAVLGLIHGLGEHIHRYEHVVEMMQAKGIAVVGYDRRGHGQSGGKRGHTPRFSDLLDEIGQLMVAIESRYPHLPIFLYGHSMGGNLLLTYLLERHPKVKGAIASAPHITLAFQPSAVTVGLGKVMRNVFPSFTQPNGLDVMKISRDSKVVAAYKADPLVHDRLTASTGVGMLEAADMLNHFSGGLDVPLLLMHGSADGITSPAGTTAFAKRVQGDVTLKIWEGLYHEIHNDPEKEEVIQYAIDWMLLKLMAS